MRFLTTLSVAAVCLALAAPASADRLRMKNGAVVDGTFLGGDARTIRFIGPDGSPKSHSINDVAGVEFGDVAAPVPAASARQARTVASRQAGITIPNNTVISVRMIDGIDAKVAAIGEKYRASISEPVMVNGQTAIARGADATVQVVRVETGGNVSGSDELAMKLFDITVNGRTYELATEYAELKTKGEGRNTVRNTAVGAGAGALIGGIFGGGKGAAIGAGVGGGAGLGVSMAKGPHLQVKPEDELSFAVRSFQLN